MSCSSSVFLDYSRVGRNEYGSLSCAADITYGFSAARGTTFHGKEQGSMGE